MKDCKQKWQVSWVLALLVIVGMTRVQGQSFTGGFTFYLPWNDSTSQRFLPHFPATPITNFIEIGPDGHFYEGTERIRFWGVNTTTGGNFPSIAKAPLVAARMRKMGINLVRFHHMDNNWGPQDGSLLNQGLASTRALNPVTLDRFHHFLYQLKTNHVYVNLNLHVSRTFKPSDGVLHADSLPEFAKMVTIYDRQLIALQKEYARQLLLTPNPYTGLAPAQDPVVAMVEISNENTLYGGWKSDALKPFAQGGGISQRHSDTLDLRWADFLRAKYPDQAALAAAYNQGVFPGGQGEQIVNGGFESGQAGPHWSVEQHNGASATFSIINSQPASGTFAGRVQVNQVTGTDWHLQFKHVGGSITQGQTYSVRFKARAALPTALTGSVMRDNAPYTWYQGFSFNLSTQWREFEFTFTAPETNAGQVRISFSFANQATTFFFDDLSMAFPEVRGLAPNESLANGTVKRTDYSRRLNYTPARLRDQAEFYLRLQRNYFAEMRQYLRDSLGVQVPITGTNALGGISDLYTQQDLDYIDDHAYWDHPWFPNIPWSNTDWLISNQPMVQSTNFNAIAGVFGGVAMAGKPYTVSEYRHAFPNRYEAEMMPWMLAYLGLHDADGVMFFDYGGYFNDWEVDHIGGYFSLHRHPVQMALSPVMGYAYRQGLIRPDPSPLTVTYSPEYLYGLPPVDAEGRWGKYYPYPARVGLVKQVRTASFAGTGAPDLSVLPPAPGNSLTTANGQTSLDQTTGLLTLHSDQFASVTGFLASASSAPAGDLRVLQANDFGVVSWLSLTDRPLRTSDLSLITLGPKVQNSGMIWYDNNQSVRNSWGFAPVQVSALNTQVELTLLADSIRLFPLSARGHDSVNTTYQPISPGRFVLPLQTATSRTLWWGVEAFGGATPVEDLQVTGWQMALFPNPAHTQVVVDLSLQSIKPVALRLSDLTGKTVRETEFLPGNLLQQYELDLKGLAPGAYLLEVRVGQERSVKRLLIE
jgi:hypothetical protein